MARTESHWLERNNLYLETAYPEGRDILINGSNKYLNFNTISGVSGYGFRDNGGVIEFKNNAGAWTPIGAGGGGAWGDITGTLSDQTDLQAALDGKVDENAAITGATKTKITYDSKGLVTAGADATTADIADSSNKRYVTDANLVVIGNTSGTNTGDQTLGSFGITASSAELNILDGATLSTTELNYVDGVTSSIQTQLDGKAPKAGGFGVILDMGIGNTIEVGTSVKLVAENAFQPTEWKLYGDNINEIELDVWASASSFPIFSSDSICNSNYPSILSGGSYADGSATGWDALASEDFLVVTVRSASGSTGKVTLQVLGNKL